MNKIIVSGISTLLLLCYFFVHSLEKISFFGSKPARLLDDWPTGYCSSCWVAVSKSYLWHASHSRGEGEAFSTTKTLDGTDMICLCSGESENSFWPINIELYFGINKRFDVVLYYYMFVNSGAGDFSKLIDRLVLSCHWSVGCFSRGRNIGFVSLIW